MRIRVLTAAIALGASGCSLLIDVERGPGGGGGGGDGGPGPTPLAAGEVFEGTGANHPDVPERPGRGFPLVVAGEFPQDAVLTLGGNTAIEIGETIVSSNGLLAATTLRVPVMEDLGADDPPLVVDIRVSSGTIREPTELRVIGLDELALHGAVSASDLQPRYSKIEVTGPTTLTGDAPVRLVATGYITLDAALSADATGAGPGPAGCPGGAGADDQECYLGTGRRGAQPHGGGGGGGHESAGLPGYNNGSPDALIGTPGAATGNQNLIPLSDEGGRGGGNGSNTTSGAGAPGGHGGGVVELTTRGVLYLGDSGSVSAAGSDGGFGNCGNQTGGGGGGGSGGAILVRSLLGPVAGNGDITARVNAAGGSGGGDPECVGGNGSAGRIRLDLPEEQDVVLADRGSAGPMWKPSTPVISADAQLTMVLVGHAGLDYGVTVNLGGIRTITMPFEGSSEDTANVDVGLEPGFNSVCVLADPEVAFSVLEAINCIEVAYIPR